ncbi:sensor histidine kinase [Hymenobacter crusticola]|uniref:Signal transduction histidine kinase internal region domain-containing protein n=1 Tax=Hymenobacter crusticola TaxID=1770526 RepID=A0A243WFZ8_9BACT|nr:histidine kinase [Hymenobacter crusticola]OUJ74673.1 hypothetical protein BXP70_07870 [Hymenobacter crusticola]
MRPSSSLAFLPSALRFSSQSRWLYMLIIPWLVPLLSYFLVGRAYWQHLGSFLGTTFLVWLLASLWLWSLDQATNAVTRRFPGLDQTAMRVVVIALTSAVLSAGFLAGTAGLFAYVQPFGSALTFAKITAGFGVLPGLRTWLSEVIGIPLSERFVSLLVFVVDFVIILLLAMVYEIVYSLNRWKESRLNIEHLRKVSLQGQLQSLKNQINPHFLFNSLNSLSSLIADEPTQAERFVDEMAKVYRYLLQTNEQELTPLAVELNFINSYYHLLKTRHGAGLQLDVQVAEKYLAHQLPPLTLQMLVENAVKHNVILTNRPLRIEIKTTPTGSLRVSNNLQRKTTRVESNHVGLHNITARYQLLAQTAPAIEAGPEQFVILLPLLS